MSDTANVSGALWCAGTMDVMGLLQQGLVDLGFLGAAEIDRYGNLNTSYVGDWRRPAVRLPGSGGGADIASLARRFVVIMPQERHRFRERVHFRGLLRACHYQPRAFVLQQIRCHSVQEFLGTRGRRRRTARPNLCH